MIVKASKSRIVLWLNLMCTKICWNYLLYFYWPLSEFPHFNTCFGKTSGLGVLSFPYPVWWNMLSGCKSQPAERREITSCAFHVALQAVLSHQPVWGAPQTAPTFCPPARSHEKFPYWYTMHWDSSLKFRADSSVHQSTRSPFSLKFLPVTVR